MPVTPQVNYPGVYVQEVPSGVRTIVGVSTSVALFIGQHKQGPINDPVLCLNFGDFERTFANYTSVGDMARYVKLFFLNGGTQCYVMRVADGATFAEVTLQNESGAADEVLTLTAKQPGLTGENIRVAVTYDGLNPESTFNIEIFISELNAVGIREKKNVEVWKNLSMDPNSSKYAPDFLTQNSKLAVAALAAAAPGLTNGFSQSGRPVAYDTGASNSLHTAWSGLIGTAGTNNEFRITVDGEGPVDIDLSTIDFTTDIRDDTLANTQADLEGAIETIIETEFTNQGIAGIDVDVELRNGPTPPVAEGDATFLLRISSANVANTGNVYIQPATQNDAAIPLMLGTTQGGLEVSAYTNRRPAPTALTFRTSDSATLIAFMEMIQNTVDQINLAGGTFTFNLAPTSNPMYRDTYAVSTTGNNDGVRQIFGMMRDAVNDHAATNPSNFRWKAELWGSRLAIIPLDGADNDIATFSTTGTNIASSFTNNVRYYSVGVNGVAGRQTPAGALAFDGNAPAPSDYDNAYKIVDKEVDLFNLMILPPEASVPMSQLWSAASVFCKKQRAFLLMDPPINWIDVQTAGTSVDALRVGLVKDYSAIFYPRITISEDRLQKNIGAAGAIAGLMARIDGSRGVWKAPAGTEADLRGVVGLEYKLSDDENGFINPRAINTLRIFPNGIVNWGARTMDGDDNFGSEYKYIPVRRLALFIEESLYRGLKWVVFEPNDEPLWAQIRLNVGAFMHNLFRQGAFQGVKKDAYFVKCDSETTTQNDINLGIVNIWVGFAPLKPAEFVILYLQQMAGQIEV